MFQDEKDKNPAENNDEEEKQIEESKKIDLLEKMKEIDDAIYTAWQRDIDKVKEIIECHEFLTQIINNNETIKDIESKFFNNNEEYFTYFIQEFSPKSTKYLLLQNIVYGENGEDKALEVLLDYCKFFLKFMLNNSDNDKSKLSSFIEIIKLIFNNSNQYYSNSYYYRQSQNHNSKKNTIDYNKYNEEYLPKKYQVLRSELKEGDEIDVLIPIQEFYSNNKVWVRGKINSIEERTFSVIVWNKDEPIELNFSSFDYAKKGLFTKDWEWRLNLKEGDIINCYKYNKLLPATIKKRIIDIENNKLEYEVTFKIYVKSVPIIDEYKKYYPDDIEIDEENNEEFIGNSGYNDEIISMCSKRLNNPLIKENDNLSFNDSLSIDDFIAEENNEGKKTITIGKMENFSFYFNTLLNEFGNLNGFDIMLKYVQNQKNETNNNTNTNNNNNNTNNDLEKQNYNNEILILIFNIFKIAMPYFYKPLLLHYAKELSEIIINYFDNLSQNELRYLKKEIIELMTDTLKECTEKLSKNNKNDNLNLLETFNLNLAIKMLKTSYLDKRTNAIKKIGEIIYNIRRINDDNFDNKLIESLKHNKVIYEIFGPNNHIQLISKSKEIIEFLLLKNELSEDDLNIIWNATKSGNLDEKKIIIKIFNEILMYNNSISDDILMKLFKSTLNKNSIGNDINDEEIDFIFNLMGKLDDENMIEQCLFNFIDYIKEIQYNNNLKNIIEKIYDITRRYHQFKKKIIEKSLEFIQNVKTLNIGYQLLNLYINHLNSYMGNEIENLLRQDNSMIIIYKKSFNNYYDNKDKINKNEHEKNLDSMIKFLYVLIQKDIWIKEESPIDFLYQFLILKKYNELDEKKFYESVNYFLENRYESLDKAYKLFLYNINLNPNHLSLEGFELFIKMFNSINKNKINLTGINRGYYETKFENNNISPDDLNGFPELKKLTFESENNEIVDRGIEIINNLYNNDIKKLLDFYKEQIYLSKKNIKIILKCILMLTELIYLNEENGTADVVSHLSLLRGETVNIKLINNSHNPKVFKINNNETIYEMKKIITKELNFHTDFLKLKIRKKEDDNSTTEIEIKRHDNGKTLKEIGFISNKEKYEIYYSKNNLDKKIQSKEILDENKNVINEVIEIFNEWFNNYSENDKMDSLHLKKFIKVVTNSKEDITENDQRLIQLMKEKDLNHDGYIEREEFINWYIESAQKKSYVVQKNIYTMGYRADLKKYSECYYEENKNKEIMFRYILGNDDTFVKNLFDLMILENGNLEIFNFLIKLTTNNDIFNEFINIKNSPHDKLNWENILFINKNWFYLCYICFIILHFIEHYKENNDFSSWIYFFIIKNGYKYLIDIFVELLKEIKEIKENIYIFCFSIILRIKKQIHSLTNNNDNTINNNNNNNLTNSLFDDSIKDKINKIDENFINKEIFPLLMNVFNLYLEKNNENDLTNEILDLIINSFPNLEDDTINEKLINLIISGLNSDNEQTGFIFYKSINHMCNNYSAKQIVIIRNLFEKIANIFNDNENQNQKKYLIDSFQDLIKFKFEKTELNEKSNFDIISYAEKIINEVNDELTINLNTPKITENKLINDILILTVLIENPQIMNEINNSKLFENILKNLIFNSTKKKEDEDITMTDLTNNDEEKMEFVNIDKINNSQDSNGFNKIHLQNISYDLILKLLKNNLSNFQQFFQIENSNKNNIPNNNNNEIDTRSNYINYFKKKYDHVGLKNLGCICYMNSTMQQLFMTPTLRYSILRFSDNKKINIINNNEISFRNNEGVDDNMFHQCQKLFTNLLLSQKYDYNPYGFTYAFKDIDGNPTKLYEQKDAQEFLAIFLDRLEQSAKKSKYKNLVNNVFGIKNCSLITCLSCGKVSYTFDPSVFLSLEVKNMKTLNDSLDKYINEEYIDGYNCDGCNKNCKISKRNILTSLPNVMIIHLQRIFYNWEIEHNEKINSRLEFPKEINMKNYTIEHILNDKENKDDNIYFRSDEYYNYYLVGVIIHIGSADSGHYYSYINTIREGEGNISYFNPKDENCLNSWLEFNDSSISQFDIQNLENEAFGGSYDDDNSFSNYRGWVREKSNNAYLLVYERLVKNPYIVYIDKPIDCNNSNLIEFNENEEKKIFKEYDMMRFYNKDNLNEYFNKCNDLYMKVFHNLKTDEYFKFEPFYFYKNNRKVPKIYYNEIMKDNQDVQKNKDISQYSNFFNTVISYFEETISNNIDCITNENAENISKIFLNYISDNISNKNEIKFIQNGCSSLLKLIKRNSEIFKEPILKLLINNDEIKRSIRYEYGSNADEFKNFYKEINSIYNFDSN